MFTSNTAATKTAHSEYLVHTDIYFTLSFYNKHTAATEKQIYFTIYFYLIEATVGENRDEIASQRQLLDNSL